MTASHADTRSPMRCALWTFALLAGCTRPALVPEEPRAISGEHLAPYQHLGECVNLRTGDRLDYLYSSSQSVRFDISYREGAATLAPVVRESSLEDSGVFIAALSTRFCLSWEAGPAGAVIDYRLRLKRAPPG